MSKLVIFMDKVLILVGYLDSKNIAHVRPSNVSDSC